jgi:hypothetical protein
MFPRLLLLALVMSLALACGSSPEGSETMATPDGGTSTAVDGGASTTTDGGTSIAADGGAGGTCSGPCKPGGGDDCSCLYNADCSPGFRCGDVDFGTCECGKRGTGKLNAPCTSGNDCETAICLDAKDGKTFCTEPCDPGGETTICGGLFSVCNGFLGLCADR